MRIIETNRLSWLVCILRADHICARTDSQEKEKRHPCRFHIAPSGGSDCRDLLLLLPVAEPTTHGSTLGYYRVLISCGTTEQNLCTAGPCYLVGDYTPGEARAVTIVTDAIVAAGYTEPGYAVNFVHSPEASFKGTTWKEWRAPCGVEPTDPKVGYGGWCDRPWCMVFINRCGSKEPRLYQLLVHELMHAVGFNHGNPAEAAKMQAAEKRVWEHIQ